MTNEISTVNAHRRWKSSSEACEGAQPPEMRTSELDSKPNKLSLNFFLSLFIFLISMMSVLFARMELKRKSYEIYKLSSEFKIHDDDFRTLYTDYSKKVSDREISGLALNSYSIKANRVGKVINIGSTSFTVKY